MKRTTITMDGYGRVAVPSDATNVWMSEMELVRLFDVIAPTLRAAIRAVYKSEVLQPYDVEKRMRLPNGYYAATYALPMVVALAFRINTPNAARVRNVLLERLCLRKDRQMLWLSLGNRVACQYARAFTQPKSARRSATFRFFGLFLFVFGWLILPVPPHFLIRRVLLRRSASFYVSRF